MNLSDIFSLLVWSLLAYIFYVLGVALYNITLHPLAKYPGPKVYGAFAFPYFWEVYNGNQASVAKALHEKYGEVVRCTPRSLCFHTSQALRDIYGTQKGKKMLQKDLEVYAPSFGGVVSLVSEDTLWLEALRLTPIHIAADDINHSRQRRVISHAFSEQALRDQEGFVHGYCDMLISKLHEQIAGPSKGKVDMVRWLNFTTFDIIGDLAFAESFQALERIEYHFWMATIFANIKNSVVFRIAKAYPLFSTILMSLAYLVPAVGETLKRLRKDTKDKTMRRISTKTDRKDFTSHFLRQADEKGINTAEIIVNGGLFIAAGSETSATLLSGMLFYLLKTPVYLSKLKDEVRYSFKGVEDMTFANETKLPYLQACMEEALRIYPPVPMELAQVTPKEGAIINGEMVAGNTSVGVPHFATFRSARNFKTPDSYRPERWLGNPEYASDDLSAVQPFSIGSRGCIGKNLPYAEIRSIICRIMWNFELELCPESNN